MAAAQKKRHVFAVDTLRAATDRSRSRLVFVLFIFTLLYGSVVVRLIDLSLRNNKAGNSVVAAVGKADLKIKRGNLLDRNGMILATNLRLASIYANPNDIINIDDAVAKITSLFKGVNKADLRKKLASNKQFIWIKRWVHPKELHDLNNLGIPGVYHRFEEKRTYPYKNLLSHVLGFVSIENKGLSGVEQNYNDMLSFPDSENKSNELQLSVDVRVQEILTSELKNIYNKHSAKAATGIIMNVDNGEIIAMASFPDFDPNVPSKVDISNTFNYATKGLFEMGSTFKTFAVASALDSKKIKMGDEFDARKPIKISRFTINDYHAKNEIMSIEDVMVHSSNIGTARIVEAMGAETEKKYFRKFNLLDELSFEVPETAKPSSPDRWGRLSAITIGYGHGISVTPLHVVSAMASIVNGGYKISPTLIKGKKPKKERVISRETSKIMNQLLRLVVRDGTGKNANVKGYMVGGKTGTAEKAGKKSYSKKLRVSSFAGAFPMNDPKYSIVVVIDEPKGIKSTWGYATAGWTAAPVVGNVIRRIGPMLGVKPVNEEEIESGKNFSIVANYSKEDNKVATR